jgi:hypothetical protein
MVKAVFYILVLLGAFIGINLYLGRLIIYVQSLYSPSNASAWTPVAAAFGCCGPENLSCGNTPRCDAVLVNLLIAGQQYYNIVGGILLGIEVRGPTAECVAPLCV